MKNKVWLFIVIGLLIAIGIGGKTFVDNQRNQKAEEALIEAERMSVVALKNTFADIKSVEFEKSQYNKRTGYYSMIVKMTNVDADFVVFDYIFTTNRPHEIEGWGVIDKEKVQKRGETNSKVKVVYTNGSEEEI
ncbi:hypothetical protein [Sporosarcina sp. 6E9]|uniref:hypothetical protein n=1 Tax=Sporosarcina sp. 6E9 TaxID=2819235 RepID=UPI001B3168AC|nr:hypothetical protein [Sporosarcina sp. 6E9]